MTAFRLYVTTLAVKVNTARRIADLLKPRQVERLTKGVATLSKHIHWKLYMGREQGTRLTPILFSFPFRDFTIPWFLDMLVRCRVMSKFCGLTMQVGGRVSV